MAEELLPEEEQQGSQDEGQHLGPRFDYSPVGEIPQQPRPQSQTDQPQSRPSRTRFRDLARELGPEAYRTARDTDPKRPDEDFWNTRFQRKKGLDPKDFAEAFENKGAKNKATALGKAAGSVPAKSAGATANNAKRLSFLAKNKKWFALGGGAFAIIIPIAMFFFWLMLFKNVHIKNLYVTYRWAQFNRGMNKTLGEEIAKAKELRKQYNERMSYE